MKENEKDFASANEETQVEVVSDEEIITSKKIEIPSLEEYKKAFTKTYNTSRIVSYVASALVFVIVIIAYTVIFPLEPNGAWAGIILIILTLIGSTIFSRYNRKKISLKVRDYMTDYNREVARIAFEDSEVNNFVYDFGGKIEKEPFVEARFLKNIVSTDSRNLVSYDVGTWHVDYADYVAHRPDGKRAKSVFYGKFLSGTRDKGIDGRIVIYVKPDPGIFKEISGPDDVEDLTLVEDAPLYRIYATTKELAKKVTKAALNTLLEIVPNNDLADVTVILHDNKIGITLTYSDAIMIVPYKEEINGDIVFEHKHNVTALNKFLSLIK